MKSVKYIFGALLLVVVAWPFAPTEASAWGCYASSPSANGRSWNYGSRGGAVRRALAECAVRTPRGQTCYIRSCS